MNERTAAVSLAMLLALLLNEAGARETAVNAQPRQEQVRSIENRPQSYVHVEPEIPVWLEPQAAPLSAEERERQRLEQSLWRSLGRGDHAAVTEAIAAGEQTLPGWRPPPRLLEELRRAEARALVARASGDAGALASLQRRFPELFSCREYYHLWSLADAHIATEDPAVAEAVHAEMLSRCRQPDVLLTTLDRIADTQGPTAALAGAAVLEHRPELRLPPGELEPRRYGWRVLQAVSLRDAGRPAQAGAVLAEVGEDVLARQDAPVARLIGWNEWDRGAYSSAAEWFARALQWSAQEQDRLPWLQARWEAGERAAVIDWLHDHSLHDATGPRWAAGVVRGQATDRFQAAAYEEALALLDLAQRLDGTEPATLAVLRGWANFKLDRFGPAHEAFAAGYRDGAAELRKDAVDGLLYTALEDGDWHALLAVADSTAGPLLSTPAERALAQQLAAGVLPVWRATAEEGRLVASAEAGDDHASSRGPAAINGLPGHTWGSIRDDLRGDSSVSFLVSQGIDWATLPGDITLGSYVEYRSLGNEWQYLYEETEGALGIELRRAPLRLGAEYLPARWRNGAGGESTGKAYLTWYHDWYEFLRRRRGAPRNPLNVDAYAGSTYGRIAHDLSGREGTSVLGFVRHGMDWRTFSHDITLHTFASYRFRFRTRDNRWYDAHGPAAGVELQKGPFTLGLDYRWEISPRRDESGGGAGIYLSWYRGWDLTP